MKEPTGPQLIEELLEAPEAFVDAGKPYELLQRYFQGLPVDTLRPLLASPDPWVQRAAGFVASELGAQAAGLVNDVLPLLLADDPHVQNYAMEVLVVNALGERAEKFAYVARKLESEHPGIRLQAMDFTANADHSQLAAAARFFERPEHAKPAHVRGLRAIAVGEGAETLLSFLREEDPLIRRYGAIGLKRLGFPLPASAFDELSDRDPPLADYLRTAAEDE